jgi:signal transduction histidine kinase/ActR/RegA family two-component response regulator
VIATLVGKLVPTADRTPHVRVALGVATAGVGVLARLALDPLLGDLIPWVTFFPVILFAAVVGGGSAGVVSLALCAFLGQFLFVAPRHTLSISTVAGAASLSAFVLVGAVVCVVGVALRRAVRALGAQTRRVQATAENLHAREAELRAQVADLTRLHDFATRLVGMRDHDAVLRSVLGAVVTVESADRGFVELLDAEGQRLVPGISVGHDDGLLPQLVNVPVGEGHGACGTAAARRSRVVVEDTETDPLFEAYRDAARTAGFRAVWSVPLLTTSGHLVGVLSTHFTAPHRPSDREIRLVELYARLAADAIEAARLYAQSEAARREAETALAAVREADRRKDEFLAMLAHELRNPLAPIRNAVAVMRAIGPQEAQLARVRDIVDRQLTHLTRLVDDLLEVSRITRGKITLMRAPVPLSEIVEEALETARHLIEQHEHTLSVTLATEAVRIDGDRERLVQVVANLLTNAAKFTPRGGHIVLDTTPSTPGEAVLTVRDTGIGILPDARARIFDLFAQEDSTLARSHGGLGIGLTLVKRLVELHGGSVRVESDGRGHGAAFTVTLPALRPAMPVEPPEVPAADGAGGPLRRVLVVEDNPDAAETLALLLSLDGHAVRVAHHGVQALRLLDEFEPDVAFIDVGLPDMDGFEVARRLRADPRTRRITLIALTGYGTEEDKQQAVAAGFDRHLTKPVDHDVIVAILAGGDAAAIRPAPSGLVH